MPVIPQSHSHDPSGNHLLDDSLDQLFQEGLGQVTHDLAELLALHHALGNSGGNPILDLHRHVGKHGLHIFAPGDGSQHQFVHPDSPLLCQILFIGQGRSIALAGDFVLSRHLGQEIVQFRGHHGLFLGILGLGQLGFIRAHLVKSVLLGLHPGRFRIGIDLGDPVLGGLGGRQGFRLFLFIFGRQVLSLLHQAVQLARLRTIALPRADFLLELGNLFLVTLELFLVAQGLFPAVRILGRFFRSFLPFLVELLLGFVNVQDFLLHGVQDFGIGIRSAGLDALSKLRSAL